jgi:hypothetical protein
VATESERPAATPNPFDGLRYYPVFIVLVIGLFFGTTCLTSSFITRGFIDQVIVPRFHPIDLRPGDVVDVGSSGGYRPVLVRHADGSVTDTGELHGPLKYLRAVPAFLAMVLVMFPAMWLMARVWPKVDAADGTSATAPAA